jgi:uncharacterized sulfatase
MFLAATTKFFGFTLEPLGIELFYYEIQEIITVIKASTKSSIRGFISFFLLALIFSGTSFGLSSVLKTKEDRRLSKIGYGVTAWFLIGAIAGMGLAPSEEDFIGSSYYYLYSNKLLLFVNEMREETRAGSLAKYEGSHYPLLRPADASDVLAPYLQEISGPPDIVFVIIEGLGKSFMRPSPQWKGFAPYLDSLREESLYWPNALSTSGSSFNVVPSIFTSLPYNGKYYPTKLVERFGIRMPDHSSLIKILDRNNYETSFYTGSDVSYNNIGDILEKEGIDRVLDESDFHKKDSKESDNPIWGVPDKKLVKKVAKKMKNENTKCRRLDILRTNSLHSPFDIPNKEKYLKEARKIIKDKNASDGEKKRYKSYREIFAEVLYADDAVKNFINFYLKEFGRKNTIFVITADHLINSIPRSETPLTRFRVPLLIYSPAIKKSQTFKAVASHLQITPTLLGHLSSEYDIEQPDSVHWMGGVIDTSTVFRSKVDLPIMERKGVFEGYIDGKESLINGEAYTIEEGLKVNKSGKRIKQRMNYVIEKYNSMTHHIIMNNKLVRTK